MSQPTQKWSITEPYLALDGLLLEAPFYEEDENCLRLVDIKKRQLHVIDLAVGPSSLKTTTFDIPVGVTIDIEGVDRQKTILIGGKVGIALLDRESGKYRYIKRFYDWDESVREVQDDRMRSNDADVDSEGRLWIGTMNDFHVGPPQPEGDLLRIDSDLSVTTHRSKISIPNSIKWNLENNTMYLVNSIDHIVDCYDFDPASGQISNPRTFWKLPTQSEPDGSAMDVDGNLWQCIFGDGKIYRLTPAGEVIGEISIPTRNVTNCVFVGTSLFITTAADEDPEKNPESAKYGGALFTIDVGVKGIPDNKFKLDDAIRGSLGL